MLKGFVFKPFRKVQSPLQLWGNENDREWL